MIDSASPEQPMARSLLHVPAAMRDLAFEKDSLREYQRGDLIVGSGKWSDAVRYVVSGKASILLCDDRDEKIAVDTLGPGDIFGEVGFFTGSPWPSDSFLVADGQCMVLEIDPEDFEKLLVSSPECSAPLVRTLVRRIIRLNRTLFQARLKKRSLQSLISRESHVFPDYHMGTYVRQRVWDRVKEMAASERPVLIIGESGVGKEGLAHSVFRASHHCKEVFLAMDLLSTASEKSSEGFLPVDSSSEEDMTQRQLRLLFGWEESGRDGGAKDTPGYFDLAEDGTLLVRRVDQLTRVAQFKLLEAVVTGAFRREGGVRQKRARVRLIATTRLNPEEVLPERHPLIDALKTSSITIPPLRTRRRELPELIDHYVEKHSKVLRRDLQKPPKETLKALFNYQWPGNDLELSNTLRRAILVSRDGVIRPEDVYFDLKRVEERGKINLLKFRPLRQALISPLYPAVLQCLAIPFFLIVLAFLFFGPTDPMKNPAAVVAWAVGWPAMIVGAFLLARFWCSVCPIGLMGNLAKRVAALEKPFPAFLRNHSDFLIAGAVIAIIWFETATGIRNSPFNLGLLLLAMMISAMVVAIVYERQSWCLYLCALGGMVGILSKTSLLELRADRNVCISQCSTNECYLGTEKESGCPYGHAGPRLHSNRLCKLCAKCVKNCPHDAINLSLRIPGREIWEERQPRPGTAFLVIGMIGGLLSELMSKSKTYQDLIAVLPFSEMVSFTVVFGAVLVCANLLLVVATALSRRVCGDSFAENYARYGLALLPLALAAFTAFHFYYLVNLGTQLPAVFEASLDLHIAETLLGTVTPEVTYFIQHVLIWCGVGWSLIVMYRISLVSREHVTQALLGSLPHAVVAVILSVMVVRSLESFFFSSM